ncbi:MAG: glycosyltransferase family 39 protein [Acidobacteriota bacterium]|nr:glycosyltransferase family 39 protein [Acidobacteriota bacterium]
MRVRHRAASTLLALAALAYGGLFTANSLVRVRTFSADSMNYVDVARRIAAGDGLVQSTGGFNQPFYLSGDLDLPSAFTAQPPGYPLAIAFVSRFGIEAPDAALGVSALAYAAILVLVYLLAQRMGGPAAAAIALGAALLFVPLTHLGRAALSECLAVAVVLMFFLLLDRHLKGTQDRGDRAAWHGLLPPLGLGLLAGAAFSVRYSLWPLPFVGVTALGLDRADRSRGAARLYSSAAFAAGALGPVTAVLGRNLYVEGHLLPPAMPSVTTLPESLSHATTAVLGGWRSTELGNWPDAALLAVVLGLLGAFAIRTARDSALPREPAFSRLPLLICLWAVLYLAAVVWRSTQANFDPIGVRLALPATVPLIPLVGGVITAALPSVRRLAWLPPAILAVCLAAAFVREATLWSTGHDARAVEFRSERQQWLRDHAVPGDLVIGGGAMDVPFLVPGSHAISYAGLPYTEVLTYLDLERIANRHCRDFDRLLLLVRPTVQLGGTRSHEDPSDWLGPFIADARAGRHEAYPLLQPLATLSEARVYKVTCP